MPESEMQKKKSFKKTDTYTFVCDVTAYFEDKSFQTATSSAPNFTKTDAAGS